MNLDHSSIGPPVVDPESIDSYEALAACVKIYREQERAAFKRWCAMYDLMRAHEDALATFEKRYPKAEP